MTATLLSAVYNTTEHTIAILRAGIAGAIADARTALAPGDTLVVPDIDERDVIKMMPGVSDFRPPRYPCIHLVTPRQIPQPSTARGESRDVVRFALFVLVQNSTSTDESLDPSGMHDLVRCGEVISAAVVEVLQEDGSTADHIVSMHVEDVVALDVTGNGRARVGRWRILVTSTVKARNARRT
jgi:hypothetical protein